jgi:hypothetical protein
MKTETITTSPSVSVLVRAVAGDLRVAGWDRSELMAKTDGDALILDSASVPLVISCDEDLILYLPRQAELKVESVAGDTSLQAVHGLLTIGPVGGDLSGADLGPLSLETVAGDVPMRHIGALTAKTIAGDFTLRSANGPCVLESVGGDASIRNVDGQVVIQKARSDLYLRNVRGGVDVSSGADVALFIVPLAGQSYRVTAGDDLIVRLPENANARLHLQAKQADDIHIDFPGAQPPEAGSSCDLVLGPDQAGIAEMVLSCGGDLLVTSQAGAWESAADFGVGMSDSGDWGGPSFPLPPDFSERINRRVQAAMEHHSVHLEAASRRAGARVEAAMRRAEAKAHAAEVRANRGHHGHVNMNVGRWSWDPSPHQPPADSSEPVSDDERLTILRMLQEKKISLEEAEKLLAALEGQ